MGSQGSLGGGWIGLAMLTGVRLFAGLWWRRRFVERKSEVRWALRVMEEISRKARPSRPLAEVIREFRDRRRVWA